MARPLRLEFPGALYHVIVRGNERKAVFRDDTDRQLYLERLSHYRKKFRFALIAYCLMDNHAHLALETGTVPLSRIMAGLQSSYTQAFNRRHRRSGHLFQGRYKAFLVDRDPYLLSLVRYVHENPLKAGIVARPGEYPWSSARHYAQGRGPEWLDMDRLLPLLGRQRTAAVKNYRTFMGLEEEEPYDQLRSYAQTIKGDEAFAERVLREAGEPAPRLRDLTVDAVARTVAPAEGLTVGDLAGPGRGRRESRARLLTALIARSEGGIPLSRAAKFFSRDPSTLAKGIERLEKNLRGDTSLRRKIAGFVRDLRK